jgi:hypothetical protein
MAKHWLNYRQSLFVRIKKIVTLDNWIFIFGGKGDNGKNMAMPLTS